MRAFRRAALAAAVLLSVAAAGCSSVAGAYEEEGRLAAGDRGFRFDDLAVRESFERAPQLRFPSRILVAGLESNRTGCYGSPGQQALVEAMGKDVGLWSEAAPLPWFLVAGPPGDVEALRRAAAQSQADLLLLYEQSVTLDQDRNALSVLNLLVLPTLFLPTVPYEATVRSAAAVVDVRNGLVYATAADERREGGIAPSAWVSGGARDLKRRLMAEALAAMHADLKERIVRR